MKNNDAMYIISKTQLIIIVFNSRRSTVSAQLSMSYYIELQQFVYNVIMDFYIFLLFQSFFDEFIINWIRWGLSG